MSNCKGHELKETCIECDVRQLARNHYFYGKLMTARDFTDEQDYHRGKALRHNRYLHGWGTVCGLKVKQHPNPACQSQYVVIEPGTAIDCCGREILVTREEYFDFRARLIELWKEQHGENAELDDKPHTLQICIRYNECETEEVPAVLGECGCDETACQPNRITEGYAFEVILDPVIEADDPIGVRFELQNTVNVAHARRVAVHDDTERLYILKGANPATLFVANTVNHSIIASQAFADSDGLEVAVSPDGDWIFVALKKTGEANPKILVLDANNLAAPPFNTLTVTGGATGNIRLVVAPDGRLYVMSSSLNQVWVWGADVTTTTPPVAPIVVAVGTAPVDIEIGRDGAYVYTANHDTANVSAIKTADLTVTNIAVGTGATAKPAALGVAATAVGDNLAVVDRDTQTLYLIGWRPEAATPAERVVPLGAPVTGFAHHPIEVLTSPAGAWIYVLEQDDTDDKAYVQAVDAHRVELGEPNVLSAAEPVGVNPQDLALTSDGRRLYVAYDGTDAPDDVDEGGVAIIDVIEEPCADLFKRALDGCPSCDDGNCLVLATIKDYVANQRVTDDRLDNLTDRKLLPSTELITEVVKCILERGGGEGERGEQGPPGLPGQNGLGIDAVSATFVDCDEPGSATITGAPPNRTLVLKIPRGCDGDDGQPGLGIDDVKVTFVGCDQPGSATIQVINGKRTLVLTIPGACDKDLTHICAINWDHGKQTSIAKIRAQGFLIAFDRPVLNSDLHRHSFIVLANSTPTQSVFVCWCELLGEVQGGNFTPPCNIGSEFKREGNPNALVNGARFFSPSLPNLPSGDYRIVVKGDFIRDLNGKGVDANHLPKWLPVEPTGDGVEGGTFESWVTVVQG